MITFKDNKNKSPLNTRWAQMTKQEQIIERKKMEIQAKLESQKQAAALAARAKLSNPTTKDEKGNTNIFSNDGSFMSQFKALLEKQKQEKEEKEQKDRLKIEEQNSQKEEAEDSDSENEYEYDERRRFDDRGPRDKQHRWNDRGRGNQHSPMNPAEERNKCDSKNSNAIPALMQISVRPPDEVQDRDPDHDDWSQDPTDSNRDDLDNKDHNKFMGPGPGHMPPGPLPPGMMGPGMLGPGHHNMGPGPMMGPGGPNMPPMPPGPMPPFMGGPPNFPMPPNFMGPNGPGGPMPPNMMHGPNGPMPPFFGAPFPGMMGPNGPPNPGMGPNGPMNPMMGPNGPPNSMMPPNGPHNSLMPPNGPPNSMIPPNGPPNSMMPPNGPPNAMIPPNGPPNSLMGPNGPPNSMMGPNGPINPLMGPNGPPNPLMGPNGPPNPLMGPNGPPMMGGGPNNQNGPHNPMMGSSGPPNPMMGNRPFMRPPFGPNGPHHFGNGNNPPFTPPPLMPDLKRLDTRAIPPPLPPPSLNQAQKPKDMHPNMTSGNAQVLSPDSFPPSVFAAASEVATNGDHWENVLKAIHSQDQNLWFLHNTNSNEYKKFRELVQKIKNERKHQVKDEDKYEPEFSLEDDDSNDAKPHFKEETSNSNPSSNFNYVKRENASSQSDEEGDSKKERRKRKKKSRWGDDLPPAAAATAAPPNLTGPKLAKIDEEGLKLTTINRNNQALMQYAMTNYGTTNLNAEDWKKCEDNFKLNLLYQDMLKKRQEVERLAAAGKHKYEYDSDEDTAEGTWEHKLRAREMNATERWADELTKQAAGKHHIGDFLPPEELRKFMEKYSAVKSGKEPDLSDYKEFKLKEDNVGFKMLQKLGWNEGQGLGAEGSGIVEPINKANQPVSNLGLGASTSDVVSPEDDEFDAYRKRMMLAYRFRPNPLNNPRRPYY